MEQKIVWKVQEFGTELLRRVSLPRSTTFTDFMQFISSLFPSWNSSSLLKYCDADGDLITMKTSSDYRECINSSCQSGTSVVKLVAIVQPTQLQAPQQSDGQSSQILPCNPQAPFSSSLLLSSSSAMYAPRSATALAVSTSSQSISNSVADLARSTAADVLMFGSTAPDSSAHVEETLRKIDESQARTQALIEEELKKLRQGPTLSVLTAADTKTEATRTATETVNAANQIVASLATL